MKKVLLQASPGVFDITPSGKVPISLLPYLPLPYPPAVLTASTLLSRSPFGDTAIRSTVGNSAMAALMLKSSTMYGSTLEGDREVTIYCTTPLFALEIG